MKMYAAASGLRTFFIYCTTAARAACHRGRFFLYSDNYALNYAVYCDILPVYLA